MEGAEYTYLTIPEAAELRSCLGVVLAGLTTRSSIGVGGLEEAIQDLEEAHAEGATSYRFALREGKILAQTERRLPDRAGEETEGSKDGESGGWRTLVELAS